MKSSYHSTTATPEWKLRASKIREHLPISGGFGLEIGPLHLPLIIKTEGDIKFADYKSREDLVAHYQADPDFPTDDIVEVDYVLLGKTLRDAVPPGTYFNYVVASHVIEHCPDIIGWLNQIAAVLAPGGILSLAIPDKRFTFDYFRTCSSTGDLLDAHLRGISIPTPKQIIDHYQAAAHIDAAQIWSGDYDERTFQRHSCLSEGYSLAQQSLDCGRYVEVHSYIFTPASFLRILASLFALEILQYRIKGFHETWRNSNEFVIALEKLPDDMELDERLRLQLQSIPEHTKEPSESYFLAGQHRHTEYGEKIRASEEALAVGALETEGLRKLASLQEAELHSLQNALRAKEAQVNELLFSKSWRVTSPLRWAGKHLRR